MSILFSIFSAARPLSCHKQLVLVAHSYQRIGSSPQLAGYVTLCVFLQDGGAMQRTVRGLHPTMRWTIGFGHWDGDDSHLINLCTDSASPKVTHGYVKAKPCEDPDCASARHCHQ